MARSLSLEGILSRTEAPPDGNGAPVDDQADDGTNGEGRGGLRATRPARPRKGKLKPGEKPRGCKFALPESVFERLRQTAIKRKTSMSVVVAEILDGKLPYFEIVQRDKPPTAD
jgi:hypothetical protein